MTKSCRACEQDFTPRGDATRGNVTREICDSCLAQLSVASLLESIDEPVLLMQGNPRQVIGANASALTLLAKELHHVEGHRGGQVFDCVHSFTEAGCGKDANCENCKIKNAIVDTFATAHSHFGVSTELAVKKDGATTNYVVQVSTEKFGELALVGLERYDARRVS